MSSKSSSSKSICSGGSADRVVLPQPDLKNITALTRNLPNNPILPWNHYDSPWSPEESNEQAEEAKSSEQTETEIETEDRTEAEIATEDAENE